MAFKEVVRKRILLLLLLLLGGALWRRRALHVCRCMNKRWPGEGPPAWRKLGWHRRRQNAPRLGVQGLGATLWSSL